MQRPARLPAFWSIAGSCYAERTLPTFMRQSAHSLMPPQKKQNRTLRTFHQLVRFILVIDEAVHRHPHIISLPLRLPRRAATGGARLRALGGGAVGSGAGRRAAAVGGTRCGGGGGRRLLLLRGRLLLLLLRLLLLRHVRSHHLLLRRKHLLLLCGSSSSSSSSACLLLARHSTRQAGTACDGAAREGSALGAGRRLRCRCCGTLLLLLRKCCLLRYRLLRCRLLSHRLLGCRLLRRRLLGSRLLRRRLLRLALLQQRLLLLLCRGSRGGVAGRLPRGMWRVLLLSQHLLLGSLVQGMTPKQLLQPILN